MRAQVEECIEIIRPALQADGGDIELKDVDESTGVISVTLVGACGTCPASTQTLKAGIERIMRDRVDGVTEVVPSESRSLGRPLVTGDVIKASMIGNVISLYINGTLMARATDSRFTSGQPGIAFFIRPGGSNRLLGLTSVTATSN